MLYGLVYRIMCWSDTLMKINNTTTWLLIYLIVQSFSQISKAGVCWEGIDDTSGTCHKAFHTNMTLKECCGVQGQGSISWTPHTQTSEVFFLNFLSPRGAPQCQRCHTSCKTVRCLAERVCRMRDGFPSCVCKPHCDRSLKALGPVCGTDGRKYKNYCTLLRKNCKEHRSVTVEYFGKCRHSCKNVRCPQNKHCLEDQNGRPHCWTCDKKCKRFIPDNPKNYFCAVDGKTYKNTCELKAEICKVGHSITFAYGGRCRENATCTKTTCPGRYMCLVNPTNKQPVCADCLSISVFCPSTKHMTLCGSDGRTYTNYCEMKRSSCASGVFVTVKKAGKCEKKKNKLLKLKGRDKGRKLKKRRNTKRKRKNKQRLKKLKQKKRKRKVKRKGKSKHNRSHQHNNKKAKLNHRRSPTSAGTGNGAIYTDEGTSEAGSQQNETNPS